MIEVKVLQNNQELCNIIEVSGHSFLARKGKDILCASVSVLVENLAISLEILLNASISSKKADGFYKLHVDEKSLSKETELLFQSALLGIGVLAQQFPNYLKLEVINHGS